MFGAQFFLQVITVVVIGPLSSILNIYQARCIHVTLKKDPNPMLAAMFHIAIADLSQGVLSSAICSLHMLERTGCAFRAISLDVGLASASLYLAIDVIMFQFVITGGTRQS